SKQVVHRIRSLQAPFGFLVGGRTAVYAVDLEQSILDHLPLALGIVAAVTLLVLFLMTGSVVLPAKAVVMNVLTLSATCGLLVLIFQDGRLQDVLAYKSQSAIEPTELVVLFAVVLG